MKDAEDEAFDELAQRQGDWGGGYQAKRKMAADKLLEEDDDIQDYKKPWVWLTDADIERIKLMTYEKETNADGEEQEAVNIDWLIRTAEHFCKEKNNGA
jgi:hypothetical protein